VDTKNLTSLQAEESISEELQAGFVCKRRLEHLKEASVADENSGGIAQWRRIRLDRMLVEYFLRQGYYNSATKLAGASELQDLTNIGNTPTLSPLLMHSLLPKELGVTLCKSMFIYLSLTHGLL